MEKITYRKGLVFVVIIIFISVNLSSITGGTLLEEKIKNNNEKYISSTGDKDISKLKESFNNKKTSEIFLPHKLCVPDIVEVGDIALCDVRPILPYHKNQNFADDHALLYKGNNRFIEATAILPMLYKGSIGLDLCKLGVINSGFVFLNLWAKNIVFGKVKNASLTQRNAAVKWAETQLGQPYQYSYKPPWPFSYHNWWACPNRNGTTYNPDTGEYFQEKYPDYWYCTELIWAAYLHCDNNSGIEIGADWWYDKSDDSWHWAIIPLDISSNADQIYLYTDGDYGNPGSSEPVVETDFVEVGTDNATLYGKLLDDGDERCHCYVTIINEKNKYSGFYKTESIDNFGNTFRCLEPGTTYQWYAWAYNSLGTVKGEIKSFTTSSSK